MVTAFKRLQEGRGKKVLVVGDFMVDTYIFGKAGRISPEAPVPIVVAEEEKVLPGGAGNVVLNLSALGVVPTILGRVGKDAIGRELKELLKKRGIVCDSLYEEEGAITSHKTRIVAHSQQVVRLDRERPTPLLKEMESQIIAQIPGLLEGISAIVVSDYAKGFVTEALFKTMAFEAGKRSIPILVDPKGIDYSKYRGATLLKPNLHEAYHAAALPKEASLEEVAVKLFAITETKGLMITRSERGISLFSPDREDFSAHAKEVIDVTGAGDTVLAAITLSLLAGLSMAEAAEIANHAASIALEHVGCVQVSFDELVQRCGDQGSLLVPLKRWSLF